MPTRPLILDLGEPIIRWVHPYEHIGRLGSVADQMFGHPELSVQEVSALVHLSPFVALPMPVHLGAAGRIFVASSHRWHPLWWIPDHVIEPQSVVSAVEPTDMRMIRIIVECINAGLLDPDSGEWEDLSRLRDVSPEDAAAEMDNLFGGPNERAAAVETSYVAFVQVEADGFEVGPKEFLTILREVDAAGAAEERLADVVPLAARWFATDQDQRGFWTDALSRIDSGEPPGQILPDVVRHLELLDQRWSEVFDELEGADVDGLAHAT